MESSNADVFMLCETWKRGDEVISCHDYVYIGHNRSLLNRNAKAGNGGVAILINRRLLSDFEIREVSRNHDGVLMVKLMVKLFTL